MEDLKLAILIDAYNISPKYVKVILDEAATFGVAACKRIYGDWSDVRLKSASFQLLRRTSTALLMKWTTARAGCAPPASVISSSSATRTLMCATSAPRA